MGKFQSELRQKGIDLDAIIRKQMERNPKTLNSLIEEAIAPDVEEIIRASTERLKRRYYKR